MKVTARDVMITPYATLLSSLYLPKALKMFKKVSEVEGEIYGMMVVDEKGHLTGVLSMYDIFLFCVPRHIQMWGAMEDIDFFALLDNAYEKAKNTRVEDIMTKEPVTITPDTPLLSILDIIIKKHIRRIPVVEADKVVGIVYASNVFYHLVDKVSD
jgi:CBS domain-containing protein